ncbi:MAG TPA: iron dependent repressor, metal binding and dimerization domain protein [Syntrophomonadaceae bacterium]|nr:iron dependent repressor, metal binding and dimerization domain protein [Syntrophomonadaceae bacterium]
MSEEEFYTFQQYMKKDMAITASMQDYLEMIYRLSQNNGYTRLYDLAAALNIQPPSATRMVQKLAKLALVDYKKYGVIALTEEGKQMGSFLLARHLTIQTFLQLIGITEGLLEETEKIEHTINSPTLQALRKLVDFFQTRPETLQELQDYMKIVEASKES